MLVVGHSTKEVLSTKELLFKECQELSKRAEQELNIYTVETDFVVFTSSVEMIGERDFWRQRPFI